ncbi:MAG TPA: hypothetical protein VEL49_05575 [Ktedonobacteraceae bacterium]|nr:hypothetical protein [Ktedonobacteraceae bacterium]
MFTKELSELIRKLIDEKIEKFREERKQANERIIANLDVVIENDKKRLGHFDMLRERVTQLENRIKLLEQEKARG